MRRLAPLVLVLAVLTGATWTAAPAPAGRSLLRAPLEVSARGSGDRWVIAAAGDIACDSPPNGRREPGSCQYDDTVDLVAESRVDAVLLLGDLQYETGAYRAFLRYFDPTWGRSSGSLHPVPGNHEYADGGPNSRPRGYFRYFGDGAKGPHRLGYYSFDLGACPDDPCWHVIALNSELCFATGGCGPAADPDARGPGNRMFRWLRADLAAHPDAAYPCTLAYWHHPRFSFSNGSGATTAVAPMWDLLYEAGADVVLNGHSHNYQRWRPQDPSGAADPDRGIREFVVGTGGRLLYSIPDGRAPDNLEAAQDGSFGVLRLTLRPERYRWAWATAAGQAAFADASDGSVPCVRAGA
ncbi:MAG: metallophosphoesterase family protein [Actinomycetota bacterium]